LKIQSGDLAEVFERGERERGERKRGSIVWLVSISIIAVCFVCFMMAIAGIAKEREDKKKRVATIAMIMNLSCSVCIYREVTGVLPPIDGKALARALDESCCMRTLVNSTPKYGGACFLTLDSNGDPVDAWGRPLLFAIENDVVTIVSLGANGTPDTTGLLSFLNDDISFKGLTAPSSSDSDAANESDSAEDGEIDLR